MSSFLTAYSQSGLLFICETNHRLAENMRSVRQGPLNLLVANHFNLPPHSNTSSIARVKPHGNGSNTPLWTNSLGSITLQCMQWVGCLMGKGWVGQVYINRYLEEWGGHDWNVGSSQVGCGEDISPCGRTNTGLKGNIISQRVVSVLNDLPKMTM